MYANSSNCYATQGMKEHEIFNSLHSGTFPFIKNAVEVNSDFQPRNVQYINFILFKEKFHSFAENKFSLVHRKLEEFVLPRERNNFGAFDCFRELFHELAEKVC
jgi:hypothetical protein